LLSETEGEWYFPCPGEKKRRTKKTSPILENSMSKPLSIPRKNKAGEFTRPLYLGLEQWQPHDLRRTASTGLSKLGCPDEIIDRIINHVKEGSISVYNRNDYDREKKLWLSRWSKYLEKLVAIP
jgi:integrase